MAEFWQWQGNATTGAGLVAFTGSQTVVISGTATAVISGTATVVVSGTATVNFSGSGTVELTGRVLVETTVHNAVALVNTTIVYSAAVDVSAYKQVFLRVYTSLANATNNSDPTVSLHTTSPLQILNGAGTAASKTLTYATYGVGLGLVILSTTEIPALAGISGSIKVGIKATVSPTSGSITVVLVGVPN